MSIELPEQVLQQIHTQVEAAYPEEGAGLLLGHVEGERRRIAAILPLANAGKEGTRHNRYLLTAQDYLHGEEEAARQGYELVGVFHSHPDHPNRPSEFDREWAMPWFIYLITSVHAGRAAESRAWRLLDDRSAFTEEPVFILDKKAASQREP